MTQMVILIEIIIEIFSLSLSYLSSAFMGLALLELVSSYD